jgi:putative hemolysin
VLPGRFPIHDLPDIGVELPEGDYNTMAGLVLDLLGRIPTAGDCATVNGWRLEVRALRGRAVTEISLAPNATAPQAGADLAAQIDGQGIHQPHAEIR